jgi:hypothetical protein
VLWEYETGFGKVLWEYETGFGKVCWDFVLGNLQHWRFYKTKKGLFSELHQKFYQTEQKLNSKVLFKITKYTTLVWTMVG